MRAHGVVCGYNSRLDTEGRRGEPLGGSADLVNNYILPYYQPSTKVLFVAHSRGGLVVRSFMNHNKQGDKTFGLITLGTPHHGSPLAVPDWAAVLWAWRVGTAPAQQTLFNSVVGTEGKLNRLDTDRIGSLNLAWDNPDNAVAGTVQTEFAPSFAQNGKVYLTPRDMNSAGTYPDSTMVYSDEYQAHIGDACGPKPKPE